MLPYHSTTDKPHTLQPSRSPTGRGIWPLVTAKL